MTRYQEELIRAAVDGEVGKVEALDGLTATGLIVTANDYDIWARYIAFQIISKKEREGVK
jgi:hypothetical protein